MIDNDFNPIERSMENNSQVNNYQSNEIVNEQKVYSKEFENTLEMQHNSEIMNLVRNEFPDACIEFVDSKGVKGIHIGLLNENSIYNLQNAITSTEKFTSLPDSTHYERLSIRLIRELFGSQSLFEGVVLSKYGVSRHILFNPLDSQDLANEEEFQSMSLLKFEDNALEIFANALKIIDNDNKQEKQRSGNNIDRVKNIITNV